jgi:hypothetical protein
MIKFLSDNKRLFLFLLMGMMAFSVLFTPVCSTLCLDSPDVTDVSHGAKCTILSHSFVQTGIGLSAIFILPFMSLLFLTSPSFFPPGFFLSLFKPPRLHA